jgi:hypothetical protein
MKKFLFGWIVLLFYTPLFAQDDLESLFEDETATEYVYASFKAPRIVLGQSIEQPASGNMIFDIQHQFGAINGGFSEFFGLDQATTRLGFTYGITDWLMLGMGRTAFQKMINTSAKVKMLRQSTGKKNMPLSISYFASIGFDGQDYSAAPYELKFAHRMTYTNQLLIARKFSTKLSLQLTPTYIHRNLVQLTTDDNGVFALGTGGRFKLNQRISINVEYFHILSEQTAQDFSNVLNLGMDIETGGHIFQLYVTNATGMLDQQFIAMSTGKWQDGDIHFGFNITRTFVVKKPKEFSE